MKFPLLFVTAVFGLHVSATPQEPPPPVLHTVTLKTLALQSGDFEGIFIKAHPEATEPITVTFNRYRRSEPVSYTGTFPIVFFRMQETDNPERPLIPVPVASFTPPENSSANEWLLFFNPVNLSAGNPFPFEVFGMDDSLGTFPSNHGLFFNATSIPFVGLVNEDRLEVPPGASPAFELSKTTTTMLAVQRDHSPLVVFENEFTLRGDTRTIIMIRPPKRKGSIRVHCYLVQESILPEAP